MDETMRLFQAAIRLIELRFRIELLTHEVRSVRQEFYSGVNNG